jgi:agmatinase
MLTFVDMIKTIINTKDLNKADIIFLSAAYEKTASSHKGTINGPKEIIKCLNTQIEFFDRKLKVEANNFIKIAHKNLDDLEKLSPLNAFKKIQENCEKLVKKNKFVFLLGGEHSVSLGLLQALTKKYKSGDVTILQIDAHCDLRDNDGDYSKNPSSLAHSTVMRRVSELGYNLVQVGIRTYSKDEYKYFSNKKNNVTVFEWGKGKIPSTEQILKSIKTKYIYITIDVDGFDPTYMLGTGTPVQGGLEWWYGVSLIEKAINKKDLIGADIVEVSPVPDSVLTEYGAAQLCYTIIANKFRKKLQ